MDEDIKLFGFIFAVMLSFFGLIGLASWFEAAHPSTCVDRLPNAGNCTHSLHVFRDGRCVCREGR